GTQLAFTAAGADGARHIYLQNVESGSVTRFADGASPAWSPFGDALAYVDGTRLVSRPVDGGAPTVLYDDPVWPVTGRPAWSPDAARVAFTTQATQSGCHAQLDWVAVAAPRVAESQRCIGAHGSDVDWGVRAKWGQINLLSGRERTIGGNGR